MKVRPLPNLADFLTVAPRGSTIFGIGRGAPNMTKSSGIDQLHGLRSGPTWTDRWHLWTAIVPRRSISGRLVWGTVWRRRNGPRWAYKKFVEYLDKDSRPA